MSGYGVNPYGEPLYRLVFSNSVTDLQGGKWPDGIVEYREVYRYPGIKNQWIMEKWQSGMEYCGTPQQWNEQEWDAENRILQGGPYPSRGVYTHCHTFIGQPTEMQVGWAVHNNKVSRDLTPGQKKQGIMDPLEKQQREQDQRFDDIWADTMGFKPNADAIVSMASGPFDRAGFKRGSDMPMPRVDQQAPLPTRDNYFGAMGKQTVARLAGE